MAPRNAILLLALLGAALCLQAAVADPAATTIEIANSGIDVDSRVVMTEPSLDEERNSDAIAKFYDDDVDASSAVGMDASSEVDVDVDDESAELGEQEEDESSPAHPLARILTQRSSRRCWTARNCKKFFKKPGCCRKKCVNLASDNKNCGKCGKCCDTKKGYCCKSGKCRKHKKGRKPSPQCGKYKKCRKGHTCCKGKCVNSRSNSGHCGKCNKGCGYGSACCHGKCKNLKRDNRNCGKCGRRCAYGRKCCNGSCTHVFGSDKDNCGACGKKCPTTCKYGMCGYGH